MSTELTEFIPTLPKGITSPPGAIKIQLDGPDAADLGEAIVILGKLAGRREAILKTDNATAEAKRKDAERRRYEAEEKAHEAREEMKARAQAEKTRKPEAPPAEAPTLTNDGDGPGIVVSQDDEAEEGDATA
jgi:hypothetical protein